MLAIIYLILGYWAAGRTVYRNRIMIGSFQTIFIRRVIVGLFLGWILIPIAIISLFTGGNR